MAAITRILVGLDLTKMDEKLIEYTAFLSACLGPAHIYFLNVQHDFDLPDQIREQYPALREPVDEQIRHQMEAEVAAGFPDVNAFPVSYEVIEGLPRKEILRRIVLKEIDLLIIGKKKDNHASGITPQQLARKATCSVLFVPEDAPTKIKHLLVPTDFSPYSQAALQQALAISRQIPSAAIECQHVYQVPYGYYKTGLTEPEFAAVIRKYAQDAYVQFLPTDTSTVQILPPVFSYQPHKSSPAISIYDHAEAANTDLIVIGARGRNAAAALILGSVTEKLIQLDQAIPLLIVKT